MIASLHIREAGPSDGAASVHRRGGSSLVPGVIAGDVVVVARLSEHLLPRPDRHRIGAFAFWSDEDALDRFLEDHEAGALLAGGWQMRMQPTRLVGSWRGLGALADHELPMDMDEPTAGLTLGQLRPSQLVRFLKASARAERDALADGAMLASSGLATAAADWWRPSRSGRASRRCGATSAAPVRMGTGGRSKSTPRPPSTASRPSCACARSRSPARLRGGPALDGRSPHSEAGWTFPHRPEIKLRGWDSNPQPIG